MKDTHALKQHLRSIVLAQPWPSSHNSSECAGPILCWELVRSLAWRHSRSFYRLEVVFCWLSRLLWMPPGGGGRLGTAHWPPLSVCSFTRTLSVGCFCCESPHVCLVLEGILKVFCFPNWMIYFEVLARQGTKLLVVWCLLTTKSVQDSVANLYIS